jgi:hypothetical protein
VSTIDLHQHVIPGAYWEASNESGEAAEGITPSRWRLVDTSRAVAKLHYRKTFAWTSDVEYMQSV